MQKIIFTTFFKDIGRDKWTSFNRSTDLYVDRFLRLATAIEYDLNVYVDKSLLDFLSNHLKDNSNVKIIDIDEVDSTYDHFYEKDLQIIKSKSYLEKIPNHRRENPEHKFAEYNAVMNSKISFIENTYRLSPDYDFYAWIDFGILQNKDTDEDIIPKFLNLKKIPFGVTYGIQNFPDTKMSFIEMLKSDVIYFDGSSFVVHKFSFNSFYSAWQDKVREMHDSFITDDDQNLVLQIYQSNPHLFNLISCEWFHLFHSFKDNA